MYEAAVSPLANWANFSVIMGSSAAALTGLMFVAIALVTQTQGQGSRQAVDTFSTPTIAHFCAVLLISATLSAPWQALWNAGILLGLSGFFGLTYALIVVRRARGLVGYKPQLEDWLWYVTLPLIAYTTLIVAAIVLPGRSTPALFAIGAVTVALLFIGIHNAWDVVTYIAIEHVQAQNDGKDWLNCCTVLKAPMPGINQQLAAAPPPMTAGLYRCGAGVLAETRWT